MAIGSLYILSYLGHIVMPQNSTCWNGIDWMSFNYFDGVYEYVGICQKIWQRRLWNITDNFTSGLCKILHLVSQQTINLGGRCQWIQMVDSTRMSRVFYSTDLGSNNDLWLLFLIYHYCWVTPMSVGEGVVYNPKSCVWYDAWGVGSTMVIYVVVETHSKLTNMPIHDAWWHVYSNYYYKMNIQL